MSFVCKWGKERLHFPLPDPHTPLSYIRNQLAQYTHLQPNSFKLVYRGQILKDDSAPIGFYNIRDGSIIGLIGTALAPLEPSVPTEESTILKIRKEVAHVQDTLLPPLESFLSSLTPPPDCAPPSDYDELKQTHRKLGELFLQSLLRLDAITPESEWEEARKERKSAVKEVQGMLDRLDGGWKDANAS